MGIYLVGFLFIGICAGALYRPHIGLIGYFGWVILRPEYLWSWALPQGLGLQKYIVVAMLLGWIIHGFPGNRIRGAALYAVIGLVFYLFMSWLSAFQSRDPAQTAFFMGIIWKIVLMSVFAIRLLDTPAKILALIWVAVLAQGFNAFEINMQYFRDGYSWAFLFGWGFNNNNTYSIATLPIMAFSAVLVLYSRRNWQKALAAAIFLFQLHQLFLLESRSCMLGAIFLGALVWWFSPKTVMLQVAAVAGIIVVGILAGPPVKEEFQSIFAEEDDRDRSAQGRFGLWAAGTGIIIDNPLLGLGPWGAETTVPQYIPGGSDRERRALHNLFFETATGSGLPATVGYLTFFFGPWFALRRFWKKNRKSANPVIATISIAALAAVPPYWLASMFSSGILLESGYLAPILASALLTMVSANVNAENETSVEKSGKFARV